MSKCDCCKEENSGLITFKGHRICPACYIGYVNNIKVCENNAKYENEINQLKKQLDESFTEEDVNGLIEDRDKTIKFLQKELAKKDEELRKYKSYKTDDERIKDLIDLYSKYAEENKQLKQQLAEKQN